MDIKPPSTNNRLPLTQGVSGPSNPASVGTQSRIVIASVVTSTEIRSASSQAKTLFDVVLKANGRDIQTQSNHAFTPGQLMKVQILDDANIRVLRVLNNLPANNSSLIQQGLRQALPLQQPQNLLLNNLQEFLRILGQQQGSQAEKVLFRQAQSQINKLLSLQPRLEQLANPVILKQAINNKSASASNQGFSKSPIQRVREALQQNGPLAKQTEQLLAGDTKAQTLKLARALAPLLANQPVSGGTTNSAESQLVSRILGALIQGQAATPIALYNVPIGTQLQHIGKQQQTSKSQQSGITAKNGFDLAISTLLRQLAASLSRIQSTQLTSLAGQTTTADATTAATWHMEIPVFTNGQFRPIQLHIEEEASPEHKNENREARQWKITMGFDFEELGEFYATLVVVENSISTTFWSERPKTLAKIQSELDILKTSLLKLGLQVNQLDCRRGTPQLKQSRLDQQLVDIKT